MKLFILAAALVLTSNAFTQDEHSDLAERIRRSSMVICQKSGHGKSTKIKFDVVKMQVLPGRVNRNQDPKNQFMWPITNIWGDFPFTIEDNGTLLYDTVYTATGWKKNEFYPNACKDAYLKVTPLIVNKSRTRFTAKLLHRWCHSHPDWGLQESSKIDVKCRIID